jgi:Glyoxalase-like domain
MDLNAAWRTDLVFDHATVLVNDLEAADARMRTEFGLGSVAGGTFPHMPGFVARLVPMQEGYLELLALTDRKLPQSEESQSTLEHLDLYGEHIAGWALRTDRLDEAATDLGLDTCGPGRWMLEGATFEVRYLWIAPDEDPPSMPWLVQYENFEFLRAFMDRALAETEHERRPLRVEALEIGGNLQEIEARVSSPVPIQTAPGPDRVAAIVIATPDGPIELRWEGGQERRT